MKTMLKYRLIWVLCLSLILVVAGSNSVQGGETSLTTGAADITLNGTYLKIQAGGIIPPGATLKTKAQPVVFNLEGLADVTVGKNSQVLIEGMTQRGKVCLLKVASGTVNVTTRELPDNISLVVETRIGTCQVAGTEFSVSYELQNDQVTEQMSVSCSQGNVELGGDFLASQGDTIRAGGSLQFQVIDCPQRKCVYFPEISASGQDLNLAIGVDNLIVVNQGSSLEAAMDYGSPGAPFAACMVKEGSAVAGGLEVTAGMPPLFIKEDHVVMGSEGQLPTARFIFPKNAEDVISSHDGDSLTIADEEFQSDVILYSDKIIAGQWIRENGQFLEQEFKMVPKEGVTNLIVGMGPAELISLPKSIEAFLRENGVIATSMPTDQAVVAYNEAVKNGLSQTTAAVIILEDYMNAEDYLAAAREAAVAWAAGEDPGSGPLTPPGFIFTPPVAGTGGSRYRPDQPGGGPDPGPGFIDGTLGGNSPPPLDPYPAISDASQSPGGTGSCFDIVEKEKWVLVSRRGGGCCGEFPIYRLKTIEKRVTIPCP